VGTAFPHHFEVLLKNEFEAVQNGCYLWVRSQSFFVSTTSLVLPHKHRIKAFVLEFSAGCGYPHLRDGCGIRKTLCADNGC